MGPVPKLPAGGSADLLPEGNSPTAPLMPTCNDMHILHCPTVFLDCELVLSPLLLSIHSGVIVWENLGLSSVCSSAYLVYKRSRDR